MKWRDEGFTLVELLIAMFMLGLVLAASSQLFLGMLGTYKQQSKMGETNINGIIGLEMFRRDVESAGSGLPWVIPAGTTYQEATDVTAAVYNDAFFAAPRAVQVGENVAAANIVAGTDYLVLKGMSLATNDACTKWQYLYDDSVAAALRVPAWTPAINNLVMTDRVIIVRPGNPETFNAGTDRTLVAPNGANLSMNQAQRNGVEGFAVPDQNLVVYGVDPNTSLRMPFNRADYVVRTGGAGIVVPGRCASGTGVLVKQIVSHANGGFPAANILPILDCVADMQITWLGPTGCGNQNGAPTLNNAGVLPVAPGACAGNTEAADVRAQLQELRIYILAHEGQRDPTFTFATNPIQVGDVGLGRNFNFVVAGIPNWQNYRWKVYTFTAHMDNLR